MRVLGQIGESRYVGDRETMIVHDRLSRESDGCLLEDLLVRNEAVAFEPDTLEQAFNEGFDYCDDCVGAAEPGVLVGERTGATVECA